MSHRSVFADALGQPGRLFRFMQNPVGARRRHFVNDQTDRVRSDVDNGVAAAVHMRSGSYLRENL
ncbi:hypothetical protein [Paenibacillus sp. HGF7]|uniref:hypothetical protein n=1 Tax=Paenibacillus sp. HGF7 TaxID=944559 RepID=UPI00020D7B12|nr:hypothetical protein [Paenibacillus sp. HGF7]EGL14899.1 hypothetical protein HMPREF9413_1911 [Paenibacillus sp. HGF7]